MKTALLTLIFIAGVTVSAHARLGENADQLVVRYGPPLKEVDNKAEGDKVASADVTFQKGGFQVEVMLIAGMSVSETFNKIDNDGLSISEVRTLLSANGQGHEWAAPVVVNGNKVWLRDDAATATLNPEGTVLLVKSKDLISAEMEAQKDAKHPTLEGF